MKAFERVLGFVTEKLSYVAMVAIVGCMVLVVIEVVRRYFFRVGVVGIVDLVELAAALILGMGIGYLTFVRGHVSVGLLVDRFSPRKQAIFDLVTCSIAIVFLILATKAMFEYAILDQARGRVTPVLFIPRYPFMHMIAVSLVLACLGLIRDVIKSVITISKAGRA